jgi:hypothetical protein
MLTQLFETDESFAKKLWEPYPKSQELIWQLSLCGERTGPLSDRIRHLADMIPPGQLIATSLVLSPEKTGRPRMAEAVRFEGRVLALIDRDGRWKWH